MTYGLVGNFCRTRMKRIHTIYRSIKHKRKVRGVALNCTKQIINKMSFWPSSVYACDSLTKSDSSNIALIIFVGKMCMYWHQSTWSWFNSMKFYDYSLRVACMCVGFFWCAWEMSRQMAALDEHIFLREIQTDDAKFTYVLFCIALSLCFHYFSPMCIQKKNNINEIRENVEQRLLHLQFGNILLFCSSFSHQFLFRKHKLTQDSHSILFII